MKRAYLLLFLALLSVSVSKGQGAEVVFEADGSGELHGDFTVDGQLYVKGNDTVFEGDITVNGETNVGSVTAELVSATNLAAQSAAVSELVVGEKGSLSAVDESFVISGETVVVDAREIRLGDNALSVVTVEGSASIVDLHAERATVGNAEVTSVSAEDAEIGTLSASVASLINLTAGFVHADELEVSGDALLSGLTVEGEASLETLTVSGGASFATSEVAFGTASGAFTFSRPDGSGLATSLEGQSNSGGAGGDVHIAAGSGLTTGGNLYLNAGEGAVKGEVFVGQTASVLHLGGEDSTIDIPASEVNVNDLYADSIVVPEITGRRSTLGGSISIDGGRGSESNGAVYIGTSSSSVEISHEGGSTTLNGDVTVTGSTNLADVSLTGDLELGSSSSPFYATRPIRSDEGPAYSTYFSAQDAQPGNRGGDLYLDAGSSDNGENGTSTEQLENIMHSLNLHYLVQREGWEKVSDWNEALSGGEKQRLVLARLLYHNPRLAVMDECTSAVSSEVESFIYHEMKQRGISCITVSHRRRVLWRFHDCLLQLHGDGTWDWQLIDQKKEEAFKNNYAY